MADTSSLIADARQFYGTLAGHNNRDWWLANKGTYDKALKAPALALLEDLTAPLATLADAPVKGKLFRPHRDVRFSKDKTPYNTHLHMMWGIETEARQSPVFFFGIGLDYVTVGAGIMEFDKAVLEDWRKFVDLDTQRIMGIVDGLQASGYGLREPALKRVPAGFASDHPAAQLLRMKGLVASREVTQTGGLSNVVLGHFKALWPLNDLLIQIAES